MGAELVGVQIFKEKRKNTQHQAKKLTLIIRIRGWKEELLRVTAGDKQSKTGTSTRGEESNEKGHAIRTGKRLRKGCRTNRGKKCPVLKNKDAEPFAVALQSRRGERDPSIGLRRWRGRTWRKGVRREKGDRSRSVNGYPRSSKRD